MSEEKLTYEELVAQLDQVKKERDQLKEEIAKTKPVDVVAPLKKFTLRDRTSIREIFNKGDQGTSFIGQDIAVAGWIRTTRKQGGGSFFFIELNDGTVQSSIQVIAQSNIPGFEQMVAKQAGESAKAAPGASLFVIGRVVSSSGHEQKIELLAHEVILLGPSDAGDYPLAKKIHTLEYLRDIAHLRPRSRTISAVSRVRNALAYATHKFFQERGYVHIHTPFLTASDCEGAGEMFSVTTLFAQSGGEVKNIPHIDGKVDFSKDFFGKPSYLTVSGQLNAEIYACALSNVYTFGPTFRAEVSHTTRHLAEFWMIEPEIAFADLLEDMDVAESYLKFCVQYAMDTCPDDIAFLEDVESGEIKQAAIDQKKNKQPQQSQPKQPKKAPQVEKIPAAEGQEAKPVEAKPVEAKPVEAKPAEAQPKKAKQKQVKKPPAEWRKKPLRERLQDMLTQPFVRLTYTEAVELLQKTGIEFEEPPVWGEELASEHERYMAEHIYQRPVIVTNYPKKFKAFYMRLNDDQKTVAAMDILVPGVGEIIGGSQREERLDVLEKRMEEVGLDKATYSWYLDLRRFGTVPHAGFGLGFERLVRYTTGLENIRDAIPFPRWHEHCKF